jgi:hypothetical protein
MREIRQPYVELGCNETQPIEREKLPGRLRMLL